MLFFNLLFWLYNKVALLAIDSKDDAYRLYGECMCVHKDVIRELLYKNATKCLNATVPKKYLFALPGCSSPRSAACSRLCSCCSSTALTSGCAPEQFQSGPNHHHARHLHA
ncbi:hypothetical protein TKK_0017638 [Trichogramma kaykai]